MLLVGMTTENGRSLFADFSFFFFYPLLSLTIEKDKKKLFRESGKTLSREREGKDNRGLKRFKW